MHKQAITWPLCQVFNWWFVRYSNAIYFTQISTSGKHVRSDPQISRESAETLDLLTFTSLLFIQMPAKWHEMVRYSNGCFHRHQQHIIYIISSSPSHLKSGLNSLVIQIPTVYEIDDLRTRLSQVMQYRRQQGSALMLLTPSQDL